MNDIEIDNHHFDNLQVWRVIAVFGVYIGHLFQRTAAPDSLIRRLTDHGYLFVELFFLISGFLAIKHFSTHAHSVCKYYKTRAIRILPLYYFIILYFYLTETFVFHDVPPDPSGLRWIRYLVVFIYGNIRSGTGYFDFWTNLGIVWTICVFATFYLFMPLFAKAIRNFYHACIAVFVFWMIHAVMVWKQPPYFYAFSYFVFFMFGVLIWFAYVEKRQKEAYLLCSIVRLEYSVRPNIDSIQ